MTAVKIHEVLTLISIKVFEENHGNLVETYLLISIKYIKMLIFFRFNKRSYYRYRTDLCKAYLIRIHLYFRKNHLKIKISIIIPRKLMF